MVFPASLETYATAVDNTTDVMAADVNLLRRTVEKLQIKMGIDSSGVVASHDYKHFQSTTTCVFGDNGAPQGWTRKTNWQDGAMFVYASAGNLAAAGATSSFGAHTHPTGSVGISIAQMAAHNHPGSSAVAGGAHTHGLPQKPYDSEYGTQPGGNDGNGTNLETDAADPVNHTHAITVAAQGSGSTHNHGVTTVNTAPYYQELLAATKN